MQNLHHGQLRHAENLSCAVSHRSWVVIWFVFQALTGKDDEKVPSAQSEKIEVQSERFSVRYEER